MRRMILGILLGVSATLAVQLACRHLPQEPDHILSDLMEWEMECLPSLLEVNGVVNMGMLSQEVEWPPHTEFYSVILYEKNSMLKAIRVPSKMSDGVFTFPSAEDIRALDESADYIPLPEIEWMTNDFETAHNSFMKQFAGKNLLNIHNESGVSFSKLTVKRGSGPTLTMKDVADGSTRGAFITSDGEETKVVRLRGYLETGGAFETNFTVVVSSEEKKEFDVRIDEELRFHVTEKEQ